MIRPLLLAVALVVTPVTLAAQSLGPDKVLTSMIVRALSPAVPVLGQDNRVHLAYELTATNISKQFITLDTVEVLDPAGTVVQTLTGPALTAVTGLYAGSGSRLEPGASAIVYMDVTFAPGAALPAELRTRITLTRQIVGPDGKPAPYPAGAPVPATVSFVGAPVVVDTRAAVVIAPPLRGPRWLAVNGCCNALTSHRTAVLGVDGAWRVPERFAIDFVQLRPDNRMFTGTGAKLTDFAYFGVPVHAVADGTVVTLYDGAPEQPPLKPATGLVPASIGGNMLVIDIGGGNFAFFAHLQPGSLRVRVGDRVRTGDVIGLLGNTGNTDAPHLHFHVMDGPSPLDANGLPFVFTAFTGMGRLGDDQLDVLFKPGGQPQVDAAAMAGPHRSQLPLNNALVGFAP